MYKASLKLRSELGLGEGSFSWTSNDAVLSYQNKNVIVIHNFGAATAELPEGQLLITSAPLNSGKLPANVTAWVKV